jgi:hypothetical protein
MKQTVIQEEIAILENRLHSKQLPPASSLIDHMLDDIDTRINKSDNSMEPNQSHSSSANEIGKINQLKTDIIYQTIISGRHMIESLEKIIFNEKQKKYLNNPDYDSIIKAIENRRLHMIQRANYIKQYKLFIYFSDNKHITPE